MSDPVMLLVAAAICLAAIPVLIYVWYRNRRFLAESLPASGVVIGLHKRPGKSGSVYAPVVRFTAADGSPVEFTESVHSYPARFKVGERVDVLYHRERQGWARVSSPGPGAHWAESVAGGSFTALLVLICLLMGAMGVISYLVRTTR